MPVAVLALAHVAYDHFLHVDMKKYPTLMGGRFIKSRRKSRQLLHANFPIHVWYDSRLPLNIHRKVSCETSSPTAGDMTSAQ